MSAILWKEMLRQGMVRSRSEATRLVKEGRVKAWVGKVKVQVDYDDMDLPGKTFIKTGRHMFSLVPRLHGQGFDQLRNWIEIPVTFPEDQDGCIHIKLADIEVDT